MSVGAFLSGRLHRGFFGYYHEILAEPPVIVPARNGHTFSTYFESGSGHVLRILCGARHVTVEALRSICDGRGLTKTVTALLVRYFEILGIATQQAGLIDWSADPRPEGAEDAYARYADLKTTSARKIGTSGEGPAYHFDRSQPVPARFVTRKFDLARVRAAAQTYDATVSEYVLAHIFRAIAHDRAARGTSEPITAMVPIDCRRFFPTETYRNFVSTATIVMPETADLAMMVQQLSQQFARIDADLVRAEISANEKLRKNIRFLPRVAAKLIVKMVERSMNRGLTTAFTNLGLVELPGEVEERVEMLEFVVADAPGIPYTFACVTVGDALTLTTTMSVEDRGLTERAAEGLEG